MRSGGSAPLILLDGGEWSTSRLSPPPPTGERVNVMIFTGKETRRAPRPAWALWTRRYVCWESKPDSFVARFN
jgi:hypothetical protein